MKKINLKISLRVHYFTLFIILTLLFLVISLFIFYQYYKKPKESKEIPLLQTKFTFSEKNYKKVINFLKKREESFRNIDQENIKDIFAK